MPANFKFESKLIENTNNLISKNEGRELIRKFHTAASKSSLFSEAQPLSSIPKPFDTRSFTLISDALLDPEVPTSYVPKVLMFLFSAIDVRYSSKKRTTRLDIVSEHTIFASDLLSSFGLENYQVPPWRWQLKREFKPAFKLPIFTDISNDILHCISLYVEAVSH